MVETVSLELTKDELTTLDIMFDLGVGRADEMRNTSNQTIEAMVGRVVLKGAHIELVQGIRNKLSRARHSFSPEQTHG